MGIKSIYYLPGINPIAVQDRIDAGFHTPHMSLKEGRALIVVKTAGVERNLSNECTILRNESQNFNLSSDKGYIFI